MNNPEVHPKKHRLTVMSSKTIADFLIKVCNLTVLLLLFLLLLTVYTNPYYNENWAKIITVVSIFMFLFQMLQMKRRKVSIIDFRLWLIVLFYVFNFGRVYLHAFSLDDQIFFNLISRYPEELLFKTSLFIICAIHAFFIGMMSRNNRKEIKKSIPSDKVVFKTGISLLIFSLPFRLFIDTINVIAIQKTGSYYSIENISGIADDFAYLFVPGVIFTLMGSKKGKSFERLLIGITIAYLSIIMLLTGDRRYQITGIIAIILSYVSKHFKKMSFKRIFPYAILGSIGINFITTIRSIRLGGLNDVFSSTTIYVFFEDFINRNIIYEIFAEFGLTFFSVVGIVDNIPERMSFLYGKTFIGTLPSILPTGWLWGDFFKSISISNIINNLNGGYHVGASLVGDLYANFGLLAIIVALFSGRILNKIFSERALHQHGYQAAKYFSQFYILVNIVRASYFEIFRLSVWVYLIPLVFIFFWKRTGRETTTKY